MSKRACIVYLALFILGTFGDPNQHGIDCTWTDPSTGDKYDLTPLKNDKEDYYIPRNTYPKQDWDIWINVCRPLVTTTCGSTAAACQQWPAGKASMGSATSMKFQTAIVPGVDGKGLTAEFSGGDPDKNNPALGDRKFELDFRCDPKVDIGKPEFMNEGPTLHYNFQWTTKYACPVHHGLSAGSVLLIITLCLVVVYFVGGILFNKFKRGLSGVEMVPNLDFWSSLPGLVKDGVMFIVNKIRGRGAYTQV